MKDKSSSNLVLLPTPEKSPYAGAKKNVKKRHWAFVLYPESAPSDWFEQLQQRGVVGAVSPLHDKDVNEDGNGTPKKAHYHVLLCYPGPQTFNAVKAITDDLGQPIPQAVESLGGYYRYLTHQDNPDKFQYDPKDIRRLGGFEIGDYVDLTRSEKRKVRKAVRAYIRQFEIYDYCILLDSLEEAELWDEEEYASNHTIEIEAYLKSRRCLASPEQRIASAEVWKNGSFKIERQGDIDYVVDTRTGEIFGEAD